ncbi:MAG: hypothetical protein U0W24_07515 [Bacteroidales bacterium]
MEKYFKILIICGLILTGLLSTCKNDEILLKGNAEIIGFVGDKCMCCWGWVIKIGNDTIKSDNAIISETLGNDIAYPVQVYIELGKLEQSCSDMGYTNSASLKDYYEIKKIKKIN